LITTSLEDIHPPVKIDPEKVKRLREERVLSQRDLAKRARISQGTVWRIENGFAEVHPRTIRRLAAALDVEPGELMIREVR